MRVGFDVSAQQSVEDTGRALGADILSFGSIVFGSFTGWAPVAADYNVRLPADTSALRVFILTMFGLYIPICFTSILGAALVTITNPEYIAAFGTDGSTGGLIAQVLSPWGGGGKFLLVLLAFSCIANNIPNTYSTALSIQALGRPLAIVPRFIWVIFTFVIYTIAGVAGPIGRHSSSLSWPKNTSSSEGPAASLEGITWQTGTNHPSFLSALQASWRDVSVSLVLLSVWHRSGTRDQSVRRQVLRMGLTLALNLRQRSLD